MFLTLTLTIAFDSGETMSAVVSHNIAVPGILAMIKDLETVERGHCVGWSLWWDATA